MSLRVGVSRIAVPPSALDRARLSWGTAYAVEAEAPSLLDEWRAAQREGLERATRRRRVANLIATVVTAIVVSAALALMGPQ